MMDRRLVAAGSIGIAFAATAALAAWASAPGPGRPAGVGGPVVSQKGRAFGPADVVVAAGGTVKVVNDDDVAHHAYVKDGSMSFDSDDQAPGSEVDVPFPVPGRYQVLCGIHPKMRLRVTVTPR